jgi:hypothetical protein
MWTLDGIMLTVTLTARFLAIGLLLAIVLAAILRQRQVNRQALVPAASGEGGRGGPVVAGVCRFQEGAAGGGETPPARAGTAGRHADDPLRKKRAGAYRKGLLVFIGLAVLTAIEFAVSMLLGSLVLLFITGLLKAAIIIQYYMNVWRLWRQEEEERA